MISKGRFIVFEGVDGTGKTTLSRHVAEELGAIWTREPGAGTEFNAEMRGIIMTGDQVPSANLFLFAADRQEHLSKVVVPMLDSGLDVVCDRYIMSTLTYQSEEWDATNLRNVVRASATINGKLILPDVVVIVESDVDVILKRLKARSESDTNRYDSIDHEVIALRFKAMRNASKTLQQLCLLSKHKTSVGCFLNNRDLETEKSSCIDAVRAVLSARCAKNAS